jgi:hypothetical protein
MRMDIDSTQVAGQDHLPAGPVIAKGRLLVLANEEKIGKPRDQPGPSCVTAMMAGAKKPPRTGKRSIF